MVSRGDNHGHTEGTQKYQHHSHVRRCLFRCAEDSGYIRQNTCMSYLCRSTCNARRTMRYPSCPRQWPSRPRQTSRPPCQHNLTIYSDAMGGLVSVFQQMEGFGQHLGGVRKLSDHRQYGRNWLPDAAANLSHPRHSTKGQANQLANQIKRQLTSPLRSRSHRLDNSTGVGRHAQAVVA